MTRVRIDASTRTVVAWCEACPSWRELRADRAAALRAAAEHAAACHDQHREAAQLRQRADRVTRPHQ